MKVNRIAKKAWILLTDGTNVFDSEVRSGIMQLAQELGFRRIRLVSEDELAAHYLNSSLFRKGLVGIVSHVRLPSIQNAIRKYRIPAVLLGEESVAEWRKAIGGPVTVCSVDNRGIGQLAADYLFEQGRFATYAFADIGFSRHTDWWSNPRYEAYRDTLAEHGYRHEVPRVSVLVDAPDVNEQAFLKFIRPLARPVAFFCCNDRAARDVINFCAAARLHVPEDVAVLGVDNEEEICTRAPTEISSIKVEHVRLGRTAFRTLVHQLEGEPPRDKIILCPPIRVIERASTRHLTVTNRYVAKAIDFIATAHPATLNANSVIAASGVSRSYLAQRFRAETGRTILDAIHIRVMKDVKRELLETEKPVAQIAEELGFSSVSCLCTVFRRLNGLSMSAFRATRRL
ncbi:MAG: substrate-binding domain-containing protein [Kiritimatiellia bacterium]